jgi:Uma2 family endonuclease
MATVTIERPDVTTLYLVPYDIYRHLSDAQENRHLRMIYLDGTLEIVSPRLEEHEIPSRWLSAVVTHVADHLGLPYHGAGSTTFRRQGVGVFGGQGKEADQSFFIQNAHRITRGRQLDLSAGDPPPDLWIEVDHRGSSKRRLNVYAALGVPEVWRYRARRNRLQFLQLVDSRYQPIDRSLALPVLTPELVLEALALGEGRLESEWIRLLRDWIARTFPRPGS